MACFRRLSEQEVKQSAKDVVKPDLQSHPDEDGTITSCRRCGRRFEPAYPEYQFCCDCRRKR